MKSIALILLCLLTACGPSENCCHERNDLAETLRLQSAQLDAVERDAEKARALLEELQSAILAEKTKTNQQK